MTDAPLIPPRLVDWLGRHWRWVVLAAWLVGCALLLVEKRAAIDAFLLTDTDDNMRLLQVRDWLGGQGWYDLRQHRMDPAMGGANIHWSRLVDLPIAALIVLLTPLLGAVDGTRWAVALAPLVPLGVLLTALAVTSRRLLGPATAILAFAAVTSGGSLSGMFNPMRIDHHGWQLALLAVALAGLVDRRPGRGGVTVGIATALSLAIGLELLIYLALVAAVQVLAFVADPDGQRQRLRGYAAALAAALAPLFALFVSQANRLPLCDALSPVWLADALLGAGLAWAMTMPRLRSWPMRLALAAAAGAVLAAFHALAFPQCLQRLEGIGPEAARLWLDHVKEARSVLSHGWRVSALILALPVSGAIGYALLAIDRRRDPEALRATLSLALPAVAALGLLFWQTRAGPSAQLLAIPGAVAIIVLLVPRALASRFALVRWLGPILLTIVGAGAATSLVLKAVPTSPPKTAKYKATVARANRQCMDAANLKTLDGLPPTIILTQVDLGPRLVAMTHHSAIAGPYHRNGDAIVDVMKAFRGTAEDAARTMQRHQARYLLVCPNMSETTVYRAKAPTGFYAQLMAGKGPDWLVPVPLPKGSPFRLWKRR